jgi:hypothetical protein
MLPPGLASVLVLFGSVPGTTQTIRVEERAGIARASEPVTLGMPFARGVLPESTPLRIIYDAVPADAQFLPMATWDDGSIKWLKCDFQATVGANAMRDYALELGVSHTPSTELDVTGDGHSLTVTTGPLRFVVSKDRFNLFDGVWLDLDGDRLYEDDEIIVPPDLATTGPVVTAGGVDYRAAAGAPDEVKVDEEGPMKVVIRVAGKHRSGADSLLKYETHITAYAGQTQVRVWHVYANGRSTPNLGGSADPTLGASFDHYAIGLSLVLGGSQIVRFGGDGGAEVAFTLGPGETARLLQKDRNALSAPLAYDIVRAGATVVASGARAEGWGDLSDAAWGLTVASRYFWQKYPKGLAFREGGLVALELAPTPEFLWVAMGTGDEILFDFHPAAEAGAAGERAMSRSKAPLLARAKPEQYAASGAFYPLLAGPSALYPQMESYVAEVTANHLANRDVMGLYGNINFGDVPYYDFGLDPDDLDASTWGSNYYDAGILTTARLFCESGDARHADIFVPAAWHFMETACWNPYDPGDWLAGFCPAYGSYHRANDHFEQHYGEGLWYYYYLTGDERAREIGLRAAVSIVEQQAWGNQNVNCRTGYQRGSACLEAWKSTRDPVFLQHAKHLLVDKILATQDVYGLIGASYEDGVVPEQTFMMALYSDALWKYIQELPASDPARPGLVAKLALLADLFDIYARKSPGEEEYWNFWTSVPDNGNPPVPVMDPGNPDATVYWDGKALVAGTYAYAYDLSGDVRYLNLARDLLDDIWIDGPQGQDDGRTFWSKVSGQTMKNMIHAVAIVEGGPAPVELARFEAVPGAGGIRVRWEASREWDHLGYALERRGPDEAGYRRLNPELIRPGDPYEWLDAEVVAGATYAYRLRALGRDGGEQVFGPIEAVALAPGAAARFRLLSVAPNPFASAVRFDLEAPRGTRAVLRIYGAGGRLVRALESSSPGARPWVVEWDGLDTGGHRVPAGVYAYRIAAPGRELGGKITRLR